MKSPHDALLVATQAAIEYLDSLGDMAIAPTVDTATLRKRLGKPFEGPGMPAGQVLTELIESVKGGILGSASGRFFGWVVGGTLASAIAADWLTSVWDQNAVLYASGPAAAIVEEIVGTWLKDLLGIPEHASFALVTGCQAAHVICLAAARHALLAKRGWDVERQGLYGASPIRILSSEQRHGSTERAIRFLGLGTDYLCATHPDKLEHLLSDSSMPTILLLQAGDINTGGFDAFESIIPLAHKYDAWVHVDGSFGLWAAASPRFRHLLRGAEAADSWAADGHK